jgi:GNAT superfamily N-acetyltransferase
MQLNDILEKYPHALKLRDGSQVKVRPLQATDEKAFHTFFCALPETERLLFKHRVTDLKVIRQWCKETDYGRILPLLAFAGKQIVADASLHQSLGGWKRHIGRLSVAVHPEYRQRGLATLLVKDLIYVARNIGLEGLEAEFMGEQVGARQAFAGLGFTELLLLKDYAKDMQALPHDYVLMGRGLKTDEEFTAAGD